MGTLTKRDLQNWLSSKFTYKEIAEATNLTESHIKKLAKEWRIGKPPRRGASYKESKATFPLGEQLYGVCSQKFSRKRNNVLQAKKWEWKIKKEDIEWVSVCPVLNTPLMWESVEEGKQDNSPCFSRRDKEKGFVKGNVLIISWKAFCMLGNGTAEDHRKVAQYLEETKI